MNMDVTTDNVNLLISIANDCYRMGQFYYSLKAFDTLERIDPDPEYWEGKRGSAIGMLLLVYRKIRTIPNGGGW